MTPYPTFIKRKILIFSVLSALSFPLVGQGAGPVFSDDFSTVALLAEKWSLHPSARWKVQDGALSVTGTGAASATPKISIPVEGAVEVSCQVKLLSTTPQSGWAGIVFRGVHFTLRPDGYWYVYRVQGADRSQGNIKKSNPPVAGQWYSLKVNHQGDRFTWYVDGEVVADFIESSTINGENKLFSLATSGGEMAVDNVSILPISSNKNISPNLVRNSSAETVLDHVPPYWKPWKVSTLPPEKFWKTWRVDATQAFDGEQSVRIESHKHQGAGMMTHQNSISAGQPVTYSVYLKADKPSLSVSLVMWEHFGKWTRKKVEVGPDWERFTFTLDEPEKGQLRCGIEVWDDGVVWVDAIQVESGREATAFRIADLDTRHEDQAVEIQDPVTVQYSPTAPVMDGQLEETIWNQQNRTWNLVPIGIKTATAQPTDTYMMMTDDTLYIAMRCHDNDMGNLVAREERHDGQVYGDDSIEILLDTHLDRQSYYHLIVNPLATRFDAGPGRNMTWNHRWDAKTYIGDDFWSVEVAIPLSSLDITSLTSDRWGVNLCRTDPSADEFSSAAIIDSLNYHCPDRFPIARIPKAPLADFRIYPHDWKLIEQADGAVELSGSLVNRSKRKRTVALDGQLGEHAWNLPPITLAAGESAPINLKDLPALPSGKSEIFIQGLLTDEGNGNILREFDLQLPIVRPRAEGTVDQGVIPLSFTPGVVPIDPLRRCLIVDGAPFFVVAPLIGVQASLEGIDRMVNHYADNGFRTLIVVGWTSKEWSDASWDRLFTQCAARNMKVIAWPVGFDRVPLETFGPFIKKWKDHPSLIAWLAVDEPELYATEEATREAVEYFQTMDPNHPVFVNNTHMGVPSRFAGLPGDIIAIDDYITNREGRKVEEIVHQVDVMEAVAKPSGRPSWIFISGNNLHNHTREPSPGEQVAQSYGSVIAGSTGLLYFEGKFAGKKHWQTVRQLNRELMQLTSVLLSIEDVPPAVCSTPDIRFTQRRVGDQVYLLAVNLSDQAYENVRFEVSGLDHGSAVVLFEDRIVDYEAGILADDFSGHERHVYRFTLHAGEQE